MSFVAKKIRVKKNPSTLVQDNRKNGSQACQKSAIPTLSRIRVAKLKVFGLRREPQGILLEKGHLRN